MPKEDYELIVSIPANSTPESRGYAISYDHETLNCISTNLHTIERLCRQVIEGRDMPPNLQWQIEVVEGLAKQTRELLGDESA